MKPDSGFINEVFTNYFMNNDYIAHIFDSDYKEPILEYDCNGIHYEIYDKENDE